MSGEKTPKLDTLAKPFQAIEVELYVDKTIGQLIKVRTPRRLKKTWADELRKLAITNRTLHLMLTKKSELNLSDKDVT